MALFLRSKAVTGLKENVLLSTHENSFNFNSGNLRGMFEL